MYLKHAVKRGLGPSYRVRFMDVNSREALDRPWRTERPLPLVILDDEVICKGSLSPKTIVQEVRRRRR
jgi:disulfide oxidoreductase YuzD